jgi:FkbM family methyltransferase
MSNKLGTTSLDAILPYTKVVGTRSFAKQPLKTVLRGIEWVVREKLARPSNFSVAFGPHRFLMQLQSMKRRYGSAGIFVQRQYYEPLLEFGHRLMSKGDIVIDGGANQGIFTCAFASAVGPIGTVYAFEPQTYALACLAQNVKLNGFENVVIFEGALSKTSGEVFLNLDDGPVAASISDTPHGEDVQRVASHSLGELFERGKIEAVHFIKLDVEGAELMTLLGAAPLLQTCKPAICIEAVDRDLYLKIANYLERYGYAAYTFCQRGDIKRLTTFSPSPNVLFLQ